MSDALLVVDVQNGVIAGVRDASGFVDRIKSIVSDARAAGVPVVWVQHSDDDLMVGSDAWRLAPGLVPEPDELVIHKSHRSAFEGTGLAERLRDAGVRRIVLTGSQSAFCVDMAGKHALVEGFDVTLVSDGHADEDLETSEGRIAGPSVSALVNRTWATLRHPGRQVTLVDRTGVRWRGPSGTRSSQAISPATTAALETFAAIAATPAPDLSQPAVAEFFDQFRLDVASLDDTQRSAFFAATADQAFAVTQQIYVHDMAPRLRALLSATTRLDLPTVAPPGGGDLWGRLEAFMTAVARLDALDPALTEIVRLRGARLHDCEVCKSRRSRDALAAGATEDDFVSIDDWPTSDLPERTKAALGLVDAMVLTPDQVPPAVIEAARDLLTLDQIVEVLLDVTRNAANKIAVALGADASQVTDGVELFTTDADGTVIVVAE